jgi:exosortase/archaeosortase family protein
MTPSARQALARVVFVVGATAAGFILLQGPFRTFEAQTVVGLLQLFGADNTQLVAGTYVEIFPSAQLPLVASITTACSCLSSLLAIACLALVAPGRRATLRWWVALTVALLAVFVGNLVRMTATLAVGLEAGRPALVGFHDWVGGTFAFAYTLFGYILFLYIVLPRRPATVGLAYDGLA